ncbi:wax synthase family protein [Aspergillus homomorphus CBS 101889]|uniref:Wax synthase domain-containing protein n=1 Tax=Aspergillus homomorphus (strain CBS 101889) TaxID=1450537 RepID=A0A395IA29_ASPHC|nr:hypothetical protein BO97DRAFT_475005 [Aspergillus homomorphus CBS 101889]RAL17072.1 hypothetical protein BO97DRAFT_475005 [Aspergillus homomorphus CBS 101889]
MAISPDLCFVGILVLQNLVTITLLTRTPRSSFLRWICLPSMLYLTYLEVVLNRLGETGFVIKIRTGGHAFTFLVQLVNLLFVTNVDLTTKADKSKVAFQLLLGIRGIGTPWQIKHIPPFPRVMRTHPPGRTQYVVRQLAIVIWQTLFFRLLTSPVLAHDPSIYGYGQEFVYTPRNCLNRFSATYIEGVIPAYLFLDIVYRLGAIICVGSGDHSISQWPPLFGTLARSYSIRLYWGRFWHQYLRWPFTSISNCITVRILRLPKPSLLEYYVNAFIVFALSGYMHIIANVVAGVEGADRSVWLFFLAQVPALMFEDGVQYLWGALQRYRQRRRRRRGCGHGYGLKVQREGRVVQEQQTLQGQQRGEKGDVVGAVAAAASPGADVDADAVADVDAGAGAGLPPLWQRCVGYAWLTAWLAFSFPWWYYPIMRTLKMKTGQSAATLSSGGAVGLEVPVLAGLVAAGAVVLHVVFKAEP